MSQELRASTNLTDRASIGVLLLLANACGFAAELGSQPADFNGTAYIKVRRVSTLEGQEKGLARITMEGLIGTCNNMRESFYSLPPVSPDAALLAKLDEQVVQKYFEVDHAATYVTGHLMKLTDFQRWTQEQRSNPKPPAPPDCAKHALTEHKTGWIWRDGIKYQLTFAQKRAVGLSGSSDFNARIIAPQRDFDANPMNMFDGQGCREVVAATAEYADGTACIWTAFPFAAFLNLPWALKAERRLGIPQKLKQVDTLIRIERNRAIDKYVFEVPSDFKLTVTADSASAREKSP